MIQSRDVTVVYRRSIGRRSVRALEGLSLHVREGDVFGLLGPNGAGKSTAMRCFLGLVQPDSGSVTVLGQRPRPGAAIFDRIAYLPEEPHYHSYLTVEEAVTFYSALYRTPPQPERVRQVVDEVGLGPFRRMRLSKCSKGMKQKVGIAVCLLRPVDLLLLDEPTRGLDPIMVKELRDLLLDLNRQGATVLMNSHVLSEVETMCNRVAILRSGKVVVEDELCRLLRPEPDVYSVDVEGESAPDILETVTRGPRSWSGTVKAEVVADLFRLASERGYRVVRCSVRERSLEEAFLSAMEDKETPHEGPALG